MKILVKFLGGIRLERGMASTELPVPDGSTVGDLEQQLRADGLDPDSDGIIVVLNDRGLKQWPAERPIEPGDRVLVLPYVGGGAG